MLTTKKGNLYALFFIIHFILGSFLVGGLTAGIPFMEGLLPSIGATQIILVFLPVLYYFFFFNTTVKDTLNLYRTRPLNYVLSALLAIASIPLVMLINVLSQFIVSPALDDTLAQIGNENYLLALLSIAVFPGIFEELVSRGIILSHYKHKSIWICSVMSGFFFGMMHLNINQFLYAFFLGFLFSIVVHLTGSIFTSMLMHFIVNSINLSLAYLASSDIFKMLEEYQEAQAALENLDQTQMLLQALPALLFLVVITAPFVGLLIFALATVNDKGSLLTKGATSIEFFDSDYDLVSGYDLATDISPDSDYGLDEDYDLEEDYHADADYDLEADYVLESENDRNHIIDDSNDMINDQDSPFPVFDENLNHQPVITVPLILTVIIFIAVSIITEFLTRSAL